MKISIVTATYNSASTIRDTLDSILIQTHEDYELIIQDGLSKDGTLDIIKEYEARFNGRMKIYSERDNGLYDAMNRGISHASGDVVGVLNSDDLYYDADVLRDIDETITKENVDCVYGNLIFFVGKKKDRTVRTWFGSQHVKGDFLRGWHPAHPTFYVRRKCFEQFGAFDTSFAVSADFELMLRFIEKNRISNRFINRYFVKMRLGGESTGSITNIIKGNRNVLRAFKKNGLKPGRLYLLRRLAPKAKAFIKSKLAK